MKIVFIVLVVLIVILSVVYTSSLVVKTCRRINLLYDYFIINNNPLSEVVESMTRRPDPTKSNGCPTEAQLQER